MNASTPRLGATLLPGRCCSFRLWAPHASRVEIVLDGGKRVELMQRDAEGYNVATLTDIERGAAYLFRLDGKLDRPDPASLLQSDGVHGPSRVVDLAFDWQSVGWRGTPLRDYVIYELHVGTFSRAGTFAGVIPELQRLKDVGVTAIELMPVAQFPGDRNWGYDGAYPFAVQSSYGGPRGLQRLVDECHRIGLAVVLDVVYNHLGPEGNYLGDFGPYFTDRYRTPWGMALNFDGPESEGVRRYFMQNALMWLEEFRIDALRLDAVHAIIDRSAKPFLEELADSVHRRSRDLGRNAYLIGESDLNDPRVVRPSELGGHGLDAMWCDDYHHAAHVLITGEKLGYYVDYGRVEDLAQAFRSAMSNPGGYSELRKRRHGRPAPDLRADQCVVSMQNHDQIGNRLFGERLSASVGFEQQKLAAGLVCLAPFIPLLFMGEEYGESAPFQYFVSHSDEVLLENIRRGRREEFESFAWTHGAPDPAAIETFERCRLNPDLRVAGQHAVLYRLYSTLLQVRTRLRREEFPDECIAYEASKVLLVQRRRRAWMVFSFSAEPEQLTLPMPPGAWEILVSSAEVGWEGPGASFPTRLDSQGEIEVHLQPHSFVCYAPPEPAAASSK
jgi:maltooligosyltrehalose trehalohydrolase